MIRLGWLRGTAVERWVFDWQTFRVLRL